VLEAKALAVHAGLIARPQLREIEGSHVAEDRLSRDGMVAYDPLGIDEQERRELGQGAQGHLLILDGIKINADAAPRAQHQEQEERPKGVQGLQPGSTYVASRMGGF
jgi:hypothetical protein